MSPYFRAYADYCSKYFAAIETLKTLRGRRKNLRERLIELQSTHGLPIESLLIKPIQRLCKYPLLLRELLSLLPEVHAQRGVLEEAAEMMNRANTEVNDKVARAERAERMLQVV